MWSFKKSNPYLLSEDDADDESKTGFLSQNLGARENNRILRLHAGFVLVHAVIAMIWLSSFCRVAWDSMFCSGFHTVPNFQPHLRLRM
jgi:hypothetical protein